MCDWRLREAMHIGGTATGGKGGFHSVAGATQRVLEHVPVLPTQLNVKIHLTPYNKIQQPEKKLLFSAQPKLSSLLVNTRLKNKEHFISCVARTKTTGKKPENCKKNLIFEKNAELGNFRKIFSHAMKFLFGKKQLKLRKNGQSRLLVIFLIFISKITPKFSMFYYSL